MLMVFELANRNSEICCQNIWVSDWPGICCHWIPDQKVIPPFFPMIHVSSHHSLFCCFWGLEPVLSPWLFLFCFFVFLPCSFSFLSDGLHSNTASSVCLQESSPRITGSQTQGESWLYYIHIFLESLTGNSVRRWFLFLLRGLQLVVDI